MGRDYECDAKGSLKGDARTPYKGNKNPSQAEYMREGYATLAMADPESPRRLKDRETLTDDERDQYSY